MSVLVGRPTDRPTDRPTERGLTRDRSFNTKSYVTVSLNSSVQKWKCSVQYAKNNLIWNVKDVSVFVIAPSGARRSIGLIISRSVKKSFTMWSNCQIWRFVWESQKLQEKQQFHRKWNANDVTDQTTCIFKELKDITDVSCVIRAVIPWTWKFSE